MLAASTDKDCYNIVFADAARLGCVHHCIIAALDRRRLRIGSRRIHVPGDDQRAYLGPLTGKSGKPSKRSAQGLSCARRRLAAGLGRDERRAGAVRHGARQPRRSRGGQGAAPQRRRPSSCRLGAARRLLGPAVAS